jgi:hypothetical protein
MGNGFIKIPIFCVYVLDFVKFMEYDVSKKSKI